MYSVHVPKNVIRVQFLTVYLQSIKTRNYEIDKLGIHSVSSVPISAHFYDGHRNRLALIG